MQQYGWKFDYQILPNRFALKLKLNLDLMLSSLSYWGLCCLRDLRSSYGHALLVLTKLSKSKFEVVQDQKTI